jgi:hypothetical protein
MHVDLPPLLSVEATGVSIPIGKREVFLTADLLGGPGLMQTSLR